MMRTTELGQLATEYLDDRKQEFKELERAVKRDMKARDSSLKVVRQEVNQLSTNMGLLIRRDVRHDYRCFKCYVFYFLERHKYRKSNIAKN